MQFHIRYLRLRTVNKHTVSYPPSEGHGHTMSELANPRSLFDCHSGTYQTLTECRQSFLLVGSDNLHWKGYALSGSSRGVSHADMTDSCGEDDGDDDDDDDETVASQEGYMFDKFAQGSSDDLYIQELLSDPREYFLHCLVSRLEIAIGEWSYLISKAEYSIEKQVRSHSSLVAAPDRNDHRAIVPCLFAGLHETER